MLNAAGVKDIVNLQFVPWGNAYYATDACGKGPYSSDERHCWFKSCVQKQSAAADDCYTGAVVAQHGEDERAANFIEACVVHLNPDWHTYWPFVQCFEADGATAESCAKSAGLDYAAIQKCATGPEGKAVEMAFAKATPDHPGVPYLVIDTTPLDFPSTLLRTVCNAYTGTKPAGCSSAALPAGDIVV